MSIDPIGPLIVAAADALRSGNQLREQLGAALDRHQIAYYQQPNYGWIDRAIWTLQGRLDAYRDGSLAGSVAEQATSIDAAFQDLTAASRSVQHVLTQLP